MHLIELSVLRQRLRNQVHSDLPQGRTTNKTVIPTPYILVVVQLGRSQVSNRRRSQSQSNRSDSEKLLSLVHRLKICMLYLQGRWHAKRSCKLNRQEISQTSSARPLRTRNRTRLYLASLPVAACLLFALQLKHRQRARERHHLCPNQLLLVASTFQEVQLDHHQNVQPIDQA
jgi:hypothetical protein